MSDLRKKLLILLFLVLMALSAFLSVIVFFLIIPLFIKIVFLVIFIFSSLICHARIMKLRHQLNYEDVVDEDLEQEVEEFEEKLEKQSVKRCPKCLNKYDGVVCLVCGHNIDKLLNQEGEEN